MRTSFSVRSMMREVDWKSQFLERLVYLMSIVKILVVLDVCILICHLGQFSIYNVLLITL
jgi:vacuolar-type H+-ATPase subunit I/STV1